MECKYYKIKIDKRTTDGNAKATMIYWIGKEQEGGKDEDFLKRTFYA